LHHALNANASATRGKEKLSALILALSLLKAQEFSGTDNRDALKASERKKMSAISSDNVRRHSNDPTLQDFVVIRIGHDEFQLTGDFHRLQEREQVGQR
jgi:hypothetical protein